MFGGDWDVRGFWALLSVLSVKSMTTTSPLSNGSLAGNNSAISTKLLQVALPPESRQLVPSMETLPLTESTSEGVVVPMPTLPELYNLFS